MDKILVSGSGTNGIVFVPGVNAKNTKHLLAQLSAQVNHYAIAQLNLWTDASDIGSRTLQEIFDAIHEAIRILRDRGAKRIFIVAKSFGAGAALACNANVDAYVLWAPAIGIGVKSNVDECLKIPLEKIEKMTDILLSNERLPSAKILVLHAEDDVTVPLRYSQQLVALRNNFSLKVLAQGKHSFQGQEHELIRETVDFLKKLQYD